MVDTYKILGAVLSSTAELVLDNLPSNKNLEELEVGMNIKEIDELLGFNPDSVDLYQLYNTVSTELSGKKQTEQVKGSRHGVDYGKAWKQIEDAARYVGEHCPNCKRDALPFVYFWQDLIRVKKGQKPRNPDNFKQWVETIKGIEVKEDEIVVPEHFKQKPCSTCEQNRERLIKALEDLERKARDAKVKLESKS